MCFVVSNVNLFTLGTELSRQNLENTSNPNTPTKTGKRNEPFLSRSTDTKKTNETLRAGFCRDLQNVQKHADSSNKMRARQKPGSSHSRRRSSGNRSRSGKSNSSSGSSRGSHSSRPRSSRLRRSICSNNNVELARKYESRAP